VSGIPLRPWPLASKPARDLTGQRFGLVVVLRMATSVGGARALVRCDCGVERIVLAGNLCATPPRTHLSCERAQKATGT
jgi:hypothetical protein